METRYQTSPGETASMLTEELRKTFLCESLMVSDEVNLVYSHYDRMIVGGIMPAASTLALTADIELKANSFLERREIGIINVGGPGKITTGNEEYELNKLSCLYAGKGVADLSFSSPDLNHPAKFFLLSAPAHVNHPTRLMHKEEAYPAVMGSVEASNQRTIYKYIHLDGIKSCQLVMGLTVLQDGSVWNSVPPHTHTRRTEVYFYFDLAPEQRVIHFMGEPTETRHLVVSGDQAVISPPWSIHCGCGSSNYAFIWGMAGENLLFTDMDQLTLAELK